MSKPIKPDEVSNLKTSRFPPQVFEAFNECIAKHWYGNRSTFTQTEVTDLILQKMPAITKAEVYERKWLDVEDSYRQAGWHVEYDRPGYCETYEATFTFKLPTRGG